MTTAKFRVSGGNFDGTSTATVEIDRNTGVMTVRPKGRHKTFALPLKDVAESVIWRVAKADAAATMVQRKIRVKRGFL